MKQNIKCHLTKFSHPGDLAPKICAPLLHILKVYNNSTHETKKVIFNSSYLITLTLQYYSYMSKHLTHKTIMIFNQQPSNLTDSWFGDTLCTNDIKSLLSY